MVDGAESRQRRRLILENFLSREECRELEFIHKSCCTVGYRPNVLSTTLLHLVATNSAHLIIPFVPIRGKAAPCSIYILSFSLVISMFNFDLTPIFATEKLKEKAEEFFGCHYELFVEFTGLIRFFFFLMC